jgi:hypothetical protein
MTAAASVLSHCGNVGFAVTAAASHAMCVLTDTLLPI